MNKAVKFTKLASSYLWQGVGIFNINTYIFMNPEITPLHLTVMQHHHCDFPQDLGSTQNLVPSLHATEILHAVLNPQGLVNISGQTHRSMSDKKQFSEG